MSNSFGALREKRGLGCGGCLLIVVLLVVAAAIIGNIIGPSDKPNGREAQQQCEDAIKTSLKSPSTAEFDSTIQINSEDENDYRILASVDSQNGFGATVRTDFSCTMLWSPEAKRWSMTDIKQR